MIETSTDIIHSTTPLIALMIAMAVSVLLIPIVWRFAGVLGMIDEPGARKVHSEAIPRVGGLGIIAGALLAIFALLDFTPIVKAFLLGAVVIIIFGIWDDIRQVQPRIKFLGQIIAISIVVFYGDLWITHLPFTDIDSVPAWIGIPFTYFAIIGMTNAVNTSDGLDGLAGGEVLLSLIVIAFLAYIAGGMEACIIASSCIGGIIGFLRYNTHTAQIFMGDAGSQFLGYSLGFLAILLTQDIYPSLSPALTLLFLGLPVIDLITVMIMRVKNGNSPFHADRTHIHHRLLDLGFDHYETVIIIYSIQALLVISGIFLRYQSDWIIIILYLSTALFILGLLRHAEQTGWQTGVQTRTTLFNTVHYVRKNTIDIIRIAIYLLQFIIPAYFILGCLFVETIPRDFGMIAGVLFVVMFVEMFYYKQKGGFSLRGGVYIVAMFSVYLVSKSEQISQIVYFNVIPFVLLAFLIAVVVRYAMDKKFQTSPMDYLIVFGVFTVAVFGGRYLQVQEIGILVVKSIIMLYGCELLLTRMEKRLNSLNIVALVAMGILAYRGLIV